MSARACSTCRVQAGRISNNSLISKGGGIYRAPLLKEIVLSPEMKALTGLTDDKTTPAELMKALLKAPVDLALVRRHRHLCEGIGAEQHGRR